MYVSTIYFVVGNSWDEGFLKGQGAFKKDKEIGRNGDKGQKKGTRDVRKGRGTFEKGHGAEAKKTRRLGEMGTKGRNKGRGTFKKRTRDEKSNPLLNNY